MDPIVFGPYYGQPPEHRPDPSPREPRYDFVLTPRIPDRARLRDRLRTRRKNRTRRP
ncbi:hypothetical protein [Streptomyces bluensis]|uniref:Uncharacterized protein n=1 Tax=Streptomyces bluensis TaxID=33897 RepID=A0ABW6UUE3_9ACTN